MPMGKPVKGAAKVVDDPVLLEQMKLAEMEQRRRQEVLLRTRLEELMNEEESMARISAKDIEARWMRFLREKKQKELVAEIEVLRNTFEKTLDRKNAVISMLSVDMDEAEEQYRLALRTHLGNIDALIDLQNRRMADLEMEFENDLLETKSDFELERTEIARKHELEKADLKLILQNMAAEAEANERKLQEETSETHETAIEKMDEEKKQMQGELTKINETIRSELDMRYKEFMANAQANMKDYMDKTKEDTDTADKIASQMRKIAKLQESIGTWKSNLSNNIRECEERNAAMKAEKEATAKHFKDLKREMQVWRKGEERRLATLVSQARKTQLSLESDAEGAARILRLVELCKDLETERERVLGFDVDVATDEVQSEVKRTMETKEQLEAAQRGDATSMNALFSISNGEMDSTVPATEEWRLLEKFWVKHNKVVLDNAAIAQEKFHLEQENQKLKNLLKQYLDGVSVNNDVMGGKNNLLQTSKFQNVVSAQESRGRVPSNITVVEGNKVVMDVGRQRAF